jgi:hypothetical protein
MKVGAGRDRVGAAVAAAGLNGSLRESTCQAAMRILRATAASAAVVLPWRLAVSQ